MKSGHSFREAMKFALKSTYPIAVSWIPIAMAFGLIVQNVGGNFLWAGLSMIICPFGTLQMLAFTFAASNVVWLTMLVTSFAVTCRHIFYGLPLLEKLRSFGKAKYYMIYMLCDELFSVYADMEIPENIDEKQAYLATAIVLQLYWLVLSMLSALLGSFIPFDLAGIEFALTALFTAILVNMVMDSKRKLPLVCAIACGLVCFLIFGADSFLAPALLMVTVVLLLLRPVLERNGKEGTDCDN